MHAQKKDHIKTQWEGGHLQAKERKPQRNQSYWHLDLEVLASSICEKINFCCLSHSVYVTAALGNWWQTSKIAISSLIIRWENFKRSLVNFPRSPSCQEAVPGSRPRQPGFKIHTTVFSYTLDMFVYCATVNQLYSRYIAEESSPHSVTYFKNTELVRHSSDKPPETK